MSLIPEYEEKDGYVLVPKEDYEKMYNGLFNIAITGVLSDSSIDEWREAFYGLHHTARRALGWNKTNKKENSQ